MIKAVVFDLNGVLITSEYLSSRFEKTYGVANEDFVAALKEIMSVVRRPGAPDIYSLFKPFFQKWNLDLNEQDFLEFWFSGEAVNTEALSFIKGLRSKGLKILVLSNNFRERTEFYRTHFPELFENIDGSYFSWETGHVKPSREAIDFVLKDQDVSPSEVIYFDDAEENIKVAEELGVNGQLWSGLEAAKNYLKSTVN